MDFLKKKHYPFYWKIALLAKDQSLCLKRKVGCVIVTPDGIMATGWNGMPPGMDNNPNYWVNNPPPLQRGRRIKAKPEVIHAERNAIDKLTRQGISPKDSVMFTTTAPCLECAKSIHNLGFSQVNYLDPFKNDDGVELLLHLNIDVTRCSI